MNVAHKFTIITGASLGLGKSFAVACAERGFPLVLVALPKEGLTEFAESLRQTYGIEVYTYEADFTHEKNIITFYEWIVERQLAVNVLISNAGIGGTKYFHEASTAYLNNIIMLNIRALTLLTKLFVPLLQAEKEAYILNVSSLAAFSPIPFKTVYPASKAFVYFFSLSLHQELKPKGISVSVLRPGAMATTEDSQERIGKHGRWGRYSMLSTEQVAMAGLRGMFGRKKVIIPGSFNQIFCMLMKLVPMPWKMPMLAKIFAKEIRQNERMTSQPTVCL